MFQAELQHETLRPFLHLSATHLLSAQQPHSRGSVGGTSWVKLAP